MDDETIETTVRLARMLTDETRINILESIRHKPQMVGEIAKIVGISPSATSNQLKALRMQNFIRVHRDGQSRVYSKNEQTEVLFKILDLCDTSVRNQEGEKK